MATIPDQFATTSTPAPTAESDYGAEDELAGGLMTMFLDEEGGQPGAASLQPNGRAVAPAGGATEQSQEPAASQQSAPPAPAAGEPPAWFQSYVESQQQRDTAFLEALRGLAPAAKPPETAPKPREPETPLDFYRTFARQRLGEHVSDRLVEQYANELIRAGGAEMLAGSKGIDEQAVGAARARFRDVDASMRETAELRARLVEQDRKIEDLTSAPKRAEQERADREDLFRYLRGDVSVMREGREVKDPASQQYPTLVAAMRETGMVEELGDHLRAISADKDPQRFITNMHANMAVLDRLLTTRDAKRAAALPPGGDKVPPSKERPKAPKLDANDRRQTARELPSDDYVDPRDAASDFANFMGPALANN